MLPSPTFRLFPRWVAHAAFVGVLIAAMCEPTHVNAQRDSTAIYENIERMTKKHRFTRMLYDAVFVPTTSDEAPPPTPSRKKRVDPYAKYKGRVIRRIEVRVFDPFGYSVEDTAYTPTGWLQKAGNALHRTTRGRIVRNLLLFAADDKVDPLAIAESERVLRASPIVNDARVTVLPIKGRKDSVDVLVLVHDKWSIGATAGVDPSSANVTLVERDLLGLGQELQQGFSYTVGEPGIDLAGHHAVYNIGRSYVTSRIFYASSTEVDQLGFTLDRPFYSPLARWAGGFALGKTWNLIDPLADTTLYGSSPYRLQPVVLDVWGAYSFRLGDQVSTASKSSNLIVGLRYAQTRYNDRPSFQADTAHVNSNTSLYLVSAGLSLRQYYKERYLFRFGYNEDVPEGLYLGMTTGLRKRELQSTAPYLGAEVARGRNTDRFGYIAMSLAYGTYFRNGTTEDGTLRAELTYFTDLIPLGRWNLRQFVRIRSVMGFDKASYTRLSLGGDELLGLTDETLIGTRKSTLNLETVAYAPFNLYGFRFAPVLRIAFGTLGLNNDAPFANRIYSAFSLGFLVRNENLLIKTFEFSIGFYPYVPSGGGQFVTDPYNTVDPRTRDYAFTKPSEVPFN